MKATYGVKHKIRMGDYGESIEVSASLEFDVDQGIVPDINAAREKLDRALEKDLKRAALYTAYSTDDTYVHEYVEGEYNHG